MNDRTLPAIPAIQSIWESKCDLKSVTDRDVEDEEKEASEGDKSDRMKNEEKKN